MVERSASIERESADAMVGKTSAAAAKEVFAALLTANDSGSYGRR
jgi:hypothetical protein